MTARYLGRYRSADMVGLRRGRDQEGEGEEEPEGEGELLCRIMQTGADTWAGHDGRGRVLRVKRGRDGALEIRHSPEPAEAAEDAFGAEAPGIGGDPSRAAGRTGDGYSRYVCTGRWDQHGAALAAYQKRLSDHYKQ